MQSSEPKVGLHTAVSIVAGSIIGSGIFMKPATMAAQTGSAPLLILVWLGAGLVSLCGALLFAEISSMFPVSGGLYVYLEKMYGNFAGFLFGWASLAVINTSAVAAIAYVCASYTGYFIPLPALPEAVVNQWTITIPFIGRLYPLDQIGIKLLGVTLLLGLGWVNARSLEGSGRLQLISTLLKIGAILLLVAGIFFSGNGNTDHFLMVSNNIPQQGTWLGGLAGAFTGAFMAYDGWQNISFMGSEVDNPGKNLPRSIIWGIVLCIAVYVALNLAFIYALPIDMMAQSPLVASDAMARVLGHTGGTISAVMIVLVTFGAINGNLMATSRITMVMAEDGFFFSRFGRQHPTFQTPANAIWLHTIWCCVFLVSGSFDMLADMFVFVTWVFIILACVGVVLLRKKMPDHPRPFRMWGYPYTLLAFTLFASFYVVSTLQYEIDAYLSGNAGMIHSLLGLLITFSGIPLYVFLSGKRKKIK